MKTFTTGTGQHLCHVHPVTDCEGHHCPIHDPSPEAEAIGRTHWRFDRGLMERICPHGVGHPDPDHIAFTRQLRGDKFAYYEGIHGCCGCCTQSTERN